MKTPTKKPIHGFTDYPRPGEKYSRKLRPVTAVSWDNNKYVRMDDGEEFKAGYLYRNRRRVPMFYKTIERRLPVRFITTVKPTRAPLRVLEGQTDGLHPVRNPK